MKKVDTAYLEDMLGAIDKINTFVSKMDFATFDQDDRTQFAVFHALEVLEEAAHALSTEFLKNNVDFSVK